MDVNINFAKYLPAKLCHMRYLRTLHRGAIDSETVQSGLLMSNRTILDGTRSSLPLSHRSWTLHGMEFSQKHHDALMGIRLRRNGYLGLSEPVPWPLYLL